MGSGGHQANAIICFNHIENGEYVRTGMCLCVRVRVWISALSRLLSLQPEKMRKTLRERAFFSRRHASYYYIQF